MTIQSTSWTGLAAAAFATLALGVSAAAAQSFPDAKDIDKLHELAKKEGKLVWYTSSAADQAKALIDAFTKRWPGVAIDAQRYVGVAQYQRFSMEAQAGHYLADILQLSDKPSIDDLIKTGQIARWRVANFDRFDPPFHLEDFAYAPYVSNAVIGYNKNKLSAQEVDLLRNGGWKAILDPRFKGRVSVTDQQSGSQYAPVFMFTDPKLDYGLEFFKQLAAQKPVVYPSAVNATDRVSAGEHDIAWAIPPTVPFAAWQSGAPINWVYPAPTPIGGTTWMAATAKGPNPNAARLFMSWITSEDGGYALQGTGQRSSIRDLPDTNPAAKEPWYKPASQTYLISDYARWERDYEKDMKVWSDTMKAAR